MSLAFPLLPEVLVRAGYRAHAVGKWHLGFKVRDYSPTFRGFHSFVGYYNSMEDYFTHHGPTPTGVCSGTDLSNSSVASGIRAAPRSLNGTYSSEIYSARAAEIFAEHARDHANSPLYLYLPFQSVHMPNEAPADMIGKATPDEEQRTAHLPRHDLRSGCGARRHDGVDEGARAVGKRRLAAERRQRWTRLVLWDEGLPVCVE